MSGPFPLSGAAKPLGPAAAQPGSAQDAARNQQMREAAEAFEAVFLRQMIGAMRQATPGETLFGNQAGEQFRDMQDARLADDMAAKSSFGIAEMLLKQFGVEE